MNFNSIKPSNKIKVSVVKKDDIDGVMLKKNIKGELYLASYDTSSNSYIKIIKIRNNSTFISFDLFRRLYNGNIQRYLRVCLISVENTGDLDQVNSYRLFIDDIPQEYNEYNSIMYILKKDITLNKFPIVYYSTMGWVSIAHKNENYISLCNSIKLHDINIHNGEIVIDVISKSSFYFRNLILRFVCSEFLKYDYEGIEISRLSSGDRIFRYTINKEIIDKYRLISVKAVLNGEIKNVLFENPDMNGMILQDEFNSYVYKVSYGQSHGLTILGSETHYEYMCSIIIPINNLNSNHDRAINSIVNSKYDTLNKYLMFGMPKSQDKSIFYHVAEMIIICYEGFELKDDYYDDLHSRFEFIKYRKVAGNICEARNVGIQEADGKYIYFMDADTILTEGVIQNAFIGLESNNLTSAAVFKVDYCKEYNNTFKNYEGIINLIDKWKICPGNISQIFLRKNLISENIRFDEQLDFGYDLFFISKYFIENNTSIILINGLCKTVICKREEYHDIPQIACYDHNYYAYYLNLILSKVIDLACVKYRYAPKYIQNLIMRKIKYRMKEDCDCNIALSVIDNNELKCFKENFALIINYICDDVILEQSNIFIEHKYYLMKTKYDKEPDVVIDGTKSWHILGDYINEISNNYFELDFVNYDYESKKLSIEGIDSELSDEYELYVEVNGKKIKAEIKNFEMDKFVFGMPILYRKYFYIDIPLDYSDISYIIKFFVCVEGHFTEKKNIRIGHFMPISKEYDKSYFVFDKWVMTRDNAEIHINKYEKLSDLNKYEEIFIKQIKRDDTHKDINQNLSVRNEAVQYRKHKILNTNNREIWLISDKINLARDNGEVFFRWLIKNKAPNIEPYFVIDKESDDYDRLSEIGSVVATGSREHKLLQVTADYVISSQANDYTVYMDKGRVYNIFRDLMHNTKFIYLQHGLIKDDHSGWLNKFNRNIYGLCCSAEEEADSVINGNYYYDNKNIWITGLPRFDRYYSAPKKIITIMPTWRKYLCTMSEVPGLNGLGIKNWIINENAEDSEYYIFYNSLLNSSRLLEAAELYNYSIKFKSHPFIQGMIDKFDYNDSIEFIDDSKDNYEIYAETDLLITDYSSSFFDFSWLKKPVIYCQFDQKNFWLSHTYKKGYFEYETKGFGEVVYDMNSLIDTIIDYMKNSCSLKDKYLRRIENFYAYFDHNSCERIYRKITESNKS